MLHKKQPASVFIFEQPQPKLAVLTVSSTPPTGEYGKQKMHYLTELSVENKRQYAAQHGFELARSPPISPPRPPSHALLDVPRRPRPPPSSPRRSSRRTSSTGARRAGTR